MTSRPMASLQAAAENLGQSSGSLRLSSAVESFREAWNDAGDVFCRSSATAREEDEADLKWTALQKLPTFKRMRRGVLVEALDDGRLLVDEVDLHDLSLREKKMLLNRILRTVEVDNERFLRRLRERIDRVGLELPKIEVRFEKLSVEGDVYVGRRALPTLLNATMNTIEKMIGFSQLSQSNTRTKRILSGVSGILSPSRMTLLLGPPGSGKTTLLMTLAGKLDHRLRMSGKITCCGHEFSEFIPQRTLAYISQHDLHSGDMTVRETLDFAGRCMGVGTRYQMLLELSRREKAAGIKPDPEIDAFMKATAIEGKQTSLVTDYVLKILGLDSCADIIVGSEMRRGISGGQKKRVTAGEILVGPARALLMDEISTGLDSSTTFQIIMFMKQMVHVMDGTMIISLLQPAPETFDLFDDIILLSEGHIVYQGPREHVLEFFEFTGFKCPERKGVADFLQEVTSKKDQEQYWFNTKEPYKYVSVSEFVQYFYSYHVGQRLQQDLNASYDKSRTHPAALATEKFGISNWELFKACFSREWMLMKRNSFIYIFKVVQITIMSIITMSIFFRTEMHHETISDGGKYLGALFFSLSNMMFNGMAELTLTVIRLPVFYKQRDFLFFPPWAFAVPIWILRIPLSLIESAIWIILTYYAIGYAPSTKRFFRQYLAFVCIHQTALSLFRFIAAIGRTIVIANTYGGFIFVVTFVLGGFVVAKDAIQPWWIWAYYISPMMYGQNALAINEFLDERWNSKNKDININAPTVGKALLKSRGMLTDGYWYWLCVGILMGLSFLYNICFVAALTFLNPYGNAHAVSEKENQGSTGNSPTKLLAKENNPKVVAVGVGATETFDPSLRDVNLRVPQHSARPSGIVLPFERHSLAFNHVNYYVDVPSEMKEHGINEKRLQLLCDVSATFRPGVLTALVGVSGAGKTTLLDVLAGRKTGGFIEGSISVSGYPKNQATFARISGYCEQNDIHSPHVTVYESLVYSAWLRLAPEVKAETRQMFIEQVLQLIELGPMRDALVGLPGVNGLTTEQRKRLTIAVELVANPSIIFMDEPTSGLDARAAAIVMRTVRNTVDTGRTVVCTIHQPSIDIFEAFDELLLMKAGGQLIYAGPIGRHSENLINYFEKIPGIPKIKKGCNPATWMLEISSPSVEAHLNLNYAEIYFNSPLYQHNSQLIEGLSTPLHGSENLQFPTKYSQSFASQCMACFWKQHCSYWRNPPYNAVRFFMTIMIGIIFGTIFWNKGKKIDKQQDLLNLVGAIYAAVFFLGAGNSTTVQPSVAIERTVFYREKASGMYSELAYAFAQVGIEVVYTAVQSIVYGALLFSMIGFAWQGNKFLLFIYFIFMSLLYFTLYGMMAVALTPMHQIAAILMSFFFSLWNLFSGFLIFRPMIPIWWRWYYWASPLAWTVYGVVVSQLGDNESPVEIPGQPSRSVKAFLKAALGYDHDFLGWVAVAHLGFVILFFFVFSYGIKHLNFQKR